MFPVKRKYIRLPNPVKITCDKCRYEWFTRSVNRYVICPRCHKPVKNPAYNHIIKLYLERECKGS